MCLGINGQGGIWEWLEMDEGKWVIMGLDRDRYCDMSWLEVWV